MKLDDLLSIDWVVIFFPYIIMLSVMILISFLIVSVILMHDSVEFLHY